MEDYKSILSDVRALYDHLILDLIDLHPSIESTLKRDHTRLLSQAECCGLPFFTIALPAGAKWFEQSLSNGRTLEGSYRPPHFGGKGGLCGDARPKIFNGLFSLVFEFDGTLRSDADISAIKSLRQLLLAAKKLKMECEQRYTDESVNSFLEIERSLPAPWYGTWNSDIPRWTRLTGHPIWGDHVERDRQTSLFDPTNPLLQLDFEPDWEGFRRFSARILSQFGLFDPAEIRSKHGPGAVSDKVDGVIKYDFRHWTDRLESVFPLDWHGSVALQPSDSTVYREFASKMCAVPKTQSGPRLIAAEPTAHQWIQQGIRQWLEEGVQKSDLRDSIDFRSQEPSRQAALAASIDGKLTTVDLKSASDRLTCRLVEYIFQVNRPLLDGLAASRTRACIALGGELLLLKKFATQGSAVIFPIQTIVYCIIAQWAVIVAHRIERGRPPEQTELRKVRVFGDDIVVPTYAYPVLKGLLETCLLEVNASKTHSTGFFRESCGMDAYKGYDVTPAYFRQVYRATPETLVSVVEVSNNFHRKGYWRTAQWLLTTVDPDQLRLIPFGAFPINDGDHVAPDEGEGEGLGSVQLRSFSGKSVSHLPRRWNKKLHRHERLVVAVENKSRNRQSHGEGRLFQYLYESTGRNAPASEPVSSRAQVLRAIKSLTEIQPYTPGQAGQAKLRIKQGWVPE